MQPTKHFLTQNEKDILLKARHRQERGKRLCDRIKRESTAYKTIRWVEDRLIKHPLFALPGHKELLKSDGEYDLILIDATETPLERPKKNKNISTPGRRKGIP